MRDLPDIAADHHLLGEAVDHFRQADRRGYKARGAVGELVTNLECAFMLDGPADRGLCAAVRTHLERPALAPAAAAFRGVVDRRVALLPGSECAILSVCEALEASPHFADLHPVLQRWCLVVAYAALVGYGPVGALLPPAPKGIRDDLGSVPGARHPHHGGAAGGGDGRGAHPAAPRIR